MLTGEYRHSIDAKKRLFIPAKHREELGTTFMTLEGLFRKGMGGICCAHPPAGAQAGGCDHAFFAPRCRSG